ncbi:MAG: hypothetical protein ACRC2T_01030 [Thermoguttaceae bacterium]
MKRISLILFGSMLFAVSGCVSQQQVAMERAMFAQEFRQLEDELYYTYQERDALIQRNRQMQSRLMQLESDGSGNGSRLVPAVNEPIIPEGSTTSTTVPSILQRPSQPKPSMPGGVNNSSNNTRGGNNGAMPNESVRRIPQPNGRNGFQSRSVPVNYKPRLRRETQEQYYEENVIPEMLVQPQDPSGFPEWSPER